MFISKFCFAPAVSGVTVEGEISCLRYLGRSFPGSDIYGRPFNASTSSQVDQWLSFCLTHFNVGANKENFEKGLKQLELHLTLRTLLVDYNITLADLIVWAELRSVFRILF